MASSVNSLAISPMVRVFSSVRLFSVPGFRPAPAREPPLGILNFSDLFDFRRPPEPSIASALGLAICGWSAHSGRYEAVQWLSMAKDWIDAPDFAFAAPGKLLHKFDGGNLLLAQSDFAYPAGHCASPKISSIAAVRKNRTRLTSMFSSRLRRAV